MECSILGFERVNLVPKQPGLNGIWRPMRRGWQISSLFECPRMESDGGDGREGVVGTTLMGFRRSGRKSLKTRSNGGFWGRCMPSSGAQ